ncbi:MAG TPA: hypothetical protein P5328_02560 [Candidatus Paceibacterota bacterium]|nr:hypothetical protein [Candidatus Paceibacterota bacterium]HRZ34326.1 hypothetical protein [Candidatus Paceibacterota bacterium]
MYYLLLISHALLNNFAGGRSNSKVYLFFIFLIVLIFLAVFVNRSNKKVEKISKYLLFLSLVIGFVLGAAAFLSFAGDFGFEWNDFVLTFNNGEISSSQLTHNHILKGSLAVVGGPLGYNYFENMDMGTPFVGLIPNWILWLGLMCVAVATISALLFFATTVSQKETPARKILYTAAFSLVVFSLIKSIPDGGVFLSNTLPMVAAFLYGIYRGKKGIVACSGVIVVYFIWTAFAWNRIFFHEWYQLKIYLLSGLISFVAIGVLFFLEKHMTNGRRAVLAGAFAVLLVTFYPTYQELMGTMKYLNTNAINGMVALYDEPDELFWEKKSSLGNLNFYEIQSGISIGEIVRKYDLLDNIYPVAVPWKTCVPVDLRGDEYAFSINTPAGNAADLENLKAALDRQLNKADIKFVEEKNGIVIYSAALNIKPCLPRHLNVIEEFLKTKFKEPFFVYNIEKTK